MNYVLGKRIFNILNHVIFPAKIQISKPIPVNLWELLGGDLLPTNSSKGEILCVAFKHTKLYLVVAYM